MVAQLHPGAPSGRLVAFNWTARLESISKMWLGRHDGPVFVPFVAPELLQYMLNAKLLAAKVGSDRQNETAPSLFGWL